MQHGVAKCNSSVFEKNKKCITDSVYRDIDHSSYHTVRISDIENFLLNKDDSSYKKISECFVKEDNQFEYLIYAFVAADKFHLHDAYHDLWMCFTYYGCYSNIGKNSKKLADYYFCRDSIHNNNKVFIKMFGQLRLIENTAQIVQNIRKSTETKKLKYNVLYGSIADYEQLKKIMYDKGNYERLLYYSYIMADRYQYEIAKKDIIDIINKFYKINDLGQFGCDILYFCEHFK